MDAKKRARRRDCILVTLSLLLFLLYFGCDDDSTSPGEEQTGATLQGKVIAFETSGRGVGSSWRSAAMTSGVLITVGTKQAETDTAGDFVLNDIPLGDQIVGFSKSGVAGNYTLSGVESGGTYTLDQVEYRGGQISTAHTGTWVGTGGSTDPGSQGQIALTMILQANGNILSGSASIGEPDNTTWSISGIEDGTSVNGSMAVVSTESPCASGGTFVGVFSADTLSGTFVEVNPPAGCGPPENGIFRVVKQ